MKRNILIFVLVALVALAAVMAIAQGKGGKCAVKPGGCAAMCQQTLGLAPEQVAAIGEVRAALANDIAAPKADLQAKMKEVAAAWAVEEPDLMEIKRLAAEADQIRAVIRDRSIDAKGAVIRILTPEQRAKCLKNCQSIGACKCVNCACVACNCGAGMGACGMGCCFLSGDAKGCPMAVGKGNGPACGMGPCGGKGPAGTGCPLKSK